MVAKSTKMERILNALFGKDLKKRPKIILTYIIVIGIFFLLFFNLRYTKKDGLEIEPSDPKDFKHIKVK